MNLDQLKAMGERMAYGLAMVFLMRLVGKGYLDTSTAEWLAGGFVMFIGGVIGFIKSRPSALLNRAQQVLPTDTKIKIEPAPTAKVEDLNKIVAVTNAANNNVTTTATAA